MSLYQKPWAQRVAAAVLAASATAGLVRSDPMNQPWDHVLASVAPLWLVCCLAWWWVRRLGGKS